MGFSLARIAKVPLAIRLPQSSFGKPGEALWQSAFAKGITAT